jgi:hypothetical protein
VAAFAIQEEAIRKKRSGRSDRKLVGPALVVRSIETIGRGDFIRRIEGGIKGCGGGGARHVTICRLRALRFAQRVACDTAAATDAGHVLAIAAHGFTTLAAGAARFLRREPVRRAEGLRGESSATGYRSLFLLVHRGEASRARCA